MANRVKPVPTVNRSDKFLAWAIIVSSALGVIDATYLLIYKLTGNNSMCLGNGGCHNVNFSTYSEIAKIPVSALGLAAYIAIIVIVLVEPQMKFVKENGPLAVFGISLGGVAFSAYLTWIELYIIHSVCPFCVASAVIITLIFILAIMRMVKQTSY
jgi:uncharacterized membrane protein